mgnify:CR=1 FL=1
MMSWRFVTFAALFVTCLLTANIMAAKLISLGGVVLTAGIVVFPVSYIVGDVLTEVWGYAAARRVIWLGFACNALMVAAIWLGGEIPSAPFWKGGAAYAEILGQTPRILTASFVAYLFGEFANSYRPGEDEDHDPRTLALDAHDRVDGGRAGARHRGVRRARLRRRGPGSAR